MVLIWSAVLIPFLVVTSAEGLQHGSGGGRIGNNSPRVSFSSSNGEDALTPKPPSSSTHIRGGSTRLDASVVRRQDAYRSSSNFPVIKTTIINHQPTVRAKQAVVNLPKPQVKKQATALQALRQKLDIGLVMGVAYFLSDICCRSSSVLMPTIAAEQAGILGSSFSQAGFVASAASMAFLGGGAGKILNGGVCKAIGAKRSVSIYLTGMAFFSLWLSFNKSAAMFGPILAGVEFCMSMRWPACLVVFEKHYRGDGAKMAAAITTLSLMSTAGQLCAKVFGAGLLSACGSWSRVAQLGFVTALMGAAVSAVLVEDKEKSEAPAPRRNNDSTRTYNGSNSVSHQKLRKENLVSSLLSSFKEVLGTKLFWLVSFGHLGAFMLATSDRLLGSFYVQASGLPESICGGLTVASTLGLIHGLQRGRGFYKLPQTSQKMAFLRKNYIMGTLSALGLALCGLPLASQLVPSKVGRAGILALASASLTSCLSFQFYQIPGMAMAKFSRNTAIFLALLDGVGYFGCGPIYAGIGQIVSRMQSYGWPLAFTLLSLLCAVSGKVMMRTIEPLLPQTEG